MINQFNGEYFFLSNFYNAPVIYDGLTFQNSEAAFQSAKVLDRSIKKQFTAMHPASAKKAGKHVQLRSDWEIVKFDIMYEICLAKFSQNADLKDKLLATGDEPLEEGNTWGDRIWGTVNGKGQNNLGKILMRVREELRSNHVLKAVNEIKNMSREDKIKFLKRGQAEEPKHFNYDMYGDFSDVSDELLDKLVEELDWIWK